LIDRGAFTRLVVPAALVGSRVVVVPHPQDWVNSRHISFVMQDNG
jgi:hypothetical protein